jgi:hypothetical protein
MDHPETAANGLLCHESNRGYHSARWRRAEGACNASSLRFGLEIGADYTWFLLGRSQVGDGGSWLVLAAVADVCSDGKCCLYACLQWLVGMVLECGDPLVAYQWACGQRFLVDRVVSEYRWWCRWTRCVFGNPGAGVVCRCRCAQWWTGDVRLDNPGTTTSISVAAERTAAWVYWSGAWCAVGRRVWSVADRALQDMREIAVATEPTISGPGVGGTWTGRRGWLG